MIKTLTGPQFASTFCLMPEQFAWFLGAGASAAAGIPTGYSMILDFKKRLFCQLSRISPREVDANDPLWQQRIDLFFSTRSELPEPDDPTEYARAFEAIYPTEAGRRTYIEQAVTRGTPSFAHRVLAALLTTRRIPCLFTTNFDQLVETATTLTDQLVPASERASMTTAAIDNAEHAECCLRESRWPFLAKLHGDFQSVELKNTTDELREQDVRLRNVLGAACARFGLVIVDYSGRDESVMAALTEALTQTNAFPGGIYWVTRSASAVLPAVSELLEKAALAGVTTAIVESPTLDELAGDIIDGIILPPVLLQHVQESRPTQILAELPLPAREQRSFPVLQCSAIPILSMPKQARSIEINILITTVRARELVRDAKARAVVASVGREIAAFGSDAELLRAFAPVGGKIAGTVDLHPDTDSWALGLLYDALTWAICRGRPLLSRLRRKGHAVPAFRGFENTFNVPLVAAKTGEAHIKLPDDVGSLGPEGRPNIRLLHALRTAMQRLALVRDHFEVVLVHLPDAWQIAFRAPSFDAHDALKALGAGHGILTQVINDRVFTFGYKASLAWRLSIALYVKAGGIPWKLAPLRACPRIRHTSGWPMP